MGILNIFKSKESKIVETYQAAMHLIEIGMCKEGLDVLKLNTEHPNSLLEIGNCYRQGLGVEQDLDTAWDYVYQAANLGWQPAIDILSEAGLLDEEEDKDEESEN